MVNAYLGRMSAAEIMKELTKMTEAERQEVLSKLVELVNLDLGSAACPKTRAGEAAHPDRIEEAGTPERAL